MSESAEVGSNRYSAPRGMRLAQVITIGIGGMVGGGIFSVLARPVQIAGGGVYLSFVVGAIVALATGYPCAKLSVRYPSRGGTSMFLDKAFGVPVTAGTFNVLLRLGFSGACEGRPCG